jgi:hypothetical protein
VAVKAEEPSSNRVRSSTASKRFLDPIPDDYEMLEYVVKMMLKEKFEKLGIELDESQRKELEEMAYRYALDYIDDYEGSLEGIIMSAAKGVRDAIVEYRDLLRSKIEKKQPNP